MDKDGGVCPEVEGIRVTLSKLFPKNNKMFQKAFPI